MFSQCPFHRVSSLRFWFCAPEPARCYSFFRVPVIWVFENVQPFRLFSPSLRTFIMITPRCSHLPCARCPRSALGLCTCCFLSAPTASSIPSNSWSDQIQLILQVSTKMSLLPASIPRSLTRFPLPSPLFPPQHRLQFCRKRKIRGRIWLRRREKTTWAIT